MSSKIDKVCAEIEKVKAKISEQQSRLRELERQKTELENTEIVELVRSLNLTPAALADFLKEQKKAPAASGQVGPKSCGAPQSECAASSCNRRRAPGRRGRAPGRAGRAGEPASSFVHRGCR